MSVLKHLTLQPKGLTTPAQLHGEIKALFAFPDSYGANLDALYDLLCQPCDAVCLTLPRALPRRRKLSRYYDRVVDILQAAAEQNPSLQLSWR